jgi:hypothetical protein
MSTKRSKCAFTLCMIVNALCPPLHARQDSITGEWNGVLAGEQTNLAKQHGGRRSGRG